MGVMETATADEASRKTLDEVMQGLGKLFAEQVTALGPERGRYVLDLLEQGRKSGIRLNSVRSNLVAALFSQARGSIRSSKLRAATWHWWKWTASRIREGFR